MPREPNIRALADCGMQALQATNGHGRRWAVARCVRQLVAQGTPAGIAERSALAMVAVAQAINERAEAARSEAALVASIKRAVQAAQQDSGGTVAYLAKIRAETVALRQEAATLTRWPGVQRVATRSSGPVPDTGLSASACD